MQTENVHHRDTLFIIVIESTHVRDSSTNVYRRDCEAETKSASKFKNFYKTLIYQKTRIQAKHHNLESLEYVPQEKQTNKTSLFLELICDLDITEPLE